MKNEREQEYLQDGVSVNEWKEMQVYSEQDSIKEVEKIRKSDNKKAFSAGDILKFNGEELKLEYPNLKDKNNKVVTEIDEYGNNFPVKDTDKKPYFVFIKYHNGKKARAQIFINDFIDMLEQAESLQTDSARRAKINDILNTVFPYTEIDFGTFTEKGERVFNEKNIHYLYDSKLIYRAFPLLDNKSNPVIYPVDWYDKDGFHHIDVLAYAGNASTGGQFGILL